MRARRKSADRRYRKSGRSRQCRIRPEFFHRRGICSTPIGTRMQAKAKSADPAENGGIPAANDNADIGRTSIPSPGNQRGRRSKFDAANDNSETGRTSISQGEFAFFGSASKPGRPFIVLGCWPPRMCADLAAIYCGEPNKQSFLRRVGLEYPQPRVSDGRRKLWLRDDLDQAILPLDLTAPRDRAEDL
jgi:hypothetical protein